MNFKEKNKQINKEMKITFVLYIGFFVWWLVTAYGLGLKPVGEYKYILGMPEWFFYSCIVGYFLFCIASIIVVKKFFKNVSFEDEENEDSGDEPKTMDKIAKMEDEESVDKTTNAVENTEASEMEVNHE